MYGEGAGVAGGWHVGGVGRVEGVSLSVNGWSLGPRGIERSCEVGNIRVGAGRGRCLEAASCKGSLS
jgi:hypothetical protein